MLTSIMIDIPVQSRYDLEEPIDLRKKPAIERERIRLSPDPWEKWKRVFLAPFLAPNLLVDKPIEAHRSSIDPFSDRLKTFGQTDSIDQEKLIDLSCHLNRSFSCSQIPNFNFDLHHRRNRHRSADDVEVTKFEMSNCDSNDFKLDTIGTGVKNRKRTPRALIGKHVKYGTGASIKTLLTLRQTIVARKKAKEMIPQGVATCQQKQKTQKLKSRKKIVNSQ
ncbi:uncharacterized protein LOC111612831 isoform X1 [Centruroides sculpturatus]|uniref:uncharacterized protein LOC111612831 isoform X1 n=2 Tax=Centruroides sculpturatus TaxID=218467 RepID=UPI000C6DC9DA|nr:uncharacterized protein LOC111612831 isoform X1 [Centruroides sculpturatus]